MAANSLLYLLLTSGLTTPPDQSVTTENPFDINAEYDPSEDATQWPGYGGNPQDAMIRWRQEPRFRTENPQYTDPPLTEDENEDWKIWSNTKRPFEPPRDKTYRPYEWQFETDEPQYAEPRQWSLATMKPKDRNYRLKAQHQQRDENADWRIFGSQTVRPFEQSEDETDEPYDWALATEKLEDETEQPEPWHQKKSNRKCPIREHFSKCHKNCEKTCSDYTERKKCPKSCTKGCVCDGGLLRNEEGKCVPRDQCQEKLMAEDDDSHGCPFEYTCFVYCDTSENKLGRCEGYTCKCFDK